MRCADDVLARGLEGALGRGQPRALEVWAASKGAGLEGWLRSGSGGLSRAVLFRNLGPEEPGQGPGEDPSSLRGPKAHGGDLGLGWGGSGNVRGCEGCSG